MLQEAFPVLVSLLVVGPRSEQMLYAKHAHAVHHASQHVRVVLRRAEAVCVAVNAQHFLERLNTEDISKNSVAEQCHSRDSGFGRDCDSSQSQAQRVSNKAFFET
jgi:hypothetical protein